MYVALDLQHLISRHGNLQMLEFNNARSLLYSNNYIDFRFHHSFLCFSCALLWFLFPPLNCAAPSFYWEGTRRSKPRTRTTATRSSPSSRRYKLTCCMWCTQTCMWCRQCIPLSMRSCIRHASYFRSSSFFVARATARCSLRASHSNFLRHNNINRASLSSTKSFGKGCPPRPRT